MGDGLRPRSAGDQKEDSGSDRRGHVLALCPAIDPRFAYRGEDVVQTLERICSETGYPASIRVDQGSEFVSRDLDLWAYANGVTLDFSRPGKPTDNAFIEAFNGRFRAECLNAHWFMSLEDAREKMERIGASTTTRFDLMARSVRKSDSAAQSRWRSQPAIVRQGRKIYLPAIQSLGSEHNRRGSNRHRMKSQWVRWRVCSLS